MRAILLMAFLVGCGAAPTHTELAPAETPMAMPTPALFAHHGPVTLRSRTPETQPPFYAELAADGSITGTRCGATRFTDDGVLERDGVAIARVSRSLSIEMPGETPIGWRIEGDALTGTDFTLASGEITSSDAEVPSIVVDPATESTLALALFATLLVCDDAGP